MQLKTASVEYLDELITRYPDLEPLKDSVAKAAHILYLCASDGGKILVCGNGGSAADSDHIVGELVKGFVLKRPLQESDIKCLKDAGIMDWESISAKLQRGIPALALTQHSALSTAITNDIDPYMVFAQQVYVHGRSGDVLLALSTSGNAKNIVTAAKVAKAFGMRIIGLTGQRESELDGFADVVIKAPATETYKVQELHLPIYHTLCLILEEEMFGA